MSKAEVKATRPVHGDTRNPEVAGLQRSIRLMLAGDPVSNNEVARQLGCATRTVARYRKRHGLPNYYGRRWGA